MSLKINRGYSYSQIGEILWKINDETLKNLIIEGMKDIKFIELEELSDGNMCVNYIRF